MNLIKSRQKSPPRNKTLAHLPRLTIFRNVKPKMATQYWASPSLISWRWFYSICADSDISNFSRPILNDFWTLCLLKLTWNRETKIWRSSLARQKSSTKLVVFCQENHCWFLVIRDDKGPRPDVDITGNSTICVPVTQTHENTSKFHRKHLPLWIIDRVKIALRPRANLRPLFSSMQMAAITYSISIDRFMSLFEVLWQIDKH